MSDLIKHECGIALIRLKKPLSYYVEKYGNPLYPFNLLYLLMEKQHNRGQDGAGIGCTKIDVERGAAYMSRERVSKGNNSLSRLFEKQTKLYDKAVRQGLIDVKDIESIKKYFPFSGEVLMGHLRYGTSGSFTESSCHPYIRRSNWPTRSLMVCGNFTMTNTAELNQKLIERGQHPIFDTDTQTVLEEIGFHLDEAHQKMYHEKRDEGMPGENIQDYISENLNVPEIVGEAGKVWDGGYVISGMVGNGDCFVLRDPRGIRPAYYFEDDEFIAFASERVPLMTVFSKDQEDIKEVPPAHVITIRRNGDVSTHQYAKVEDRKSCTFERIYFSRGNDPEIYEERKALGAALVEPVLEAIDNDLKNTVYSFVPNTAEVAFNGMVNELRRNRRDKMALALKEKLASGELSAEFIDEIVKVGWTRNEKIANKDIKLRTFISQEKGRSKMVSHVYDITYGVVKPNDNLVVLDDSIVRGTTLRESILSILSRTNPKRIIVVSTAPQIRYPDCYGIDMSELGKFIAFQAAIALLKEQGQESLLKEIYENCLREVTKPSDQQVNLVKQVYSSFSAEQISDKISELIYPKVDGWNGEVKIIYQTIEDLHKCLPEHKGDWYFTGNFPTSGGTAICNRAFINYYENKNVRAY